MKRDEINDVEYLYDHYGELLQYGIYDLSCTRLERHIADVVFPELAALMEELNKYREEKGGYWFSRIAADKVGFKEHPGHALVMAIPDAYADEPVDFPVQTQQSTVMANRDSGYAWPALVWKSKAGLDDVVIPSFVVDEIDREIRLALGQQVEGSFVKPQPYYLPVVMQAAKDVAFGGYWMDFHCRERMATCYLAAVTKNNLMASSGSSPVVPSRYAEEVPGRLGAVIGQAMVLTYK